MLRFRWNKKYNFNFKIFLHFLKQQLCLEDIIYNYKYGSKFLKIM